MLVFTKANGRNQINDESIEEGSTHWFLNPLGVVCLQFAGQVPCKHPLMSELRGNFGTENVIPTVILLFPNLTFITKLNLFFAMNTDLNLKYLYLKLISSLFYRIMLPLILLNLLPSTFRHFPLFFNPMKL